MRGNARVVMILGAARLLSEQGLEGTSFAHVLGETGAPRGSLYHHFPGGKRELVAEAVRYAGSLLDKGLGTAASDDPAEVMSAFTALWRRLLADSGLTAGCAVAAVAIGAPQDHELAAVTSEVFEHWSDLLADHLRRTGITDPTARDLAVTAIAAVEGALILSRASQDLRPIDAVTGQLRQLARLAGQQAAETSVADRDPRRAGTADGTAPRPAS
ncbi:MAG: TetR/AcrR family transcriptional regulator [Actinobacteria bacterium]|nr:TetR/AcrR family transcriptional regulator [Actinomycetota bacterium]